MRWEKKKNPYRNPIESGEKYPSSPLTSLDFDLLKLFLQVPCELSPGLFDVLEDCKCPIYCWLTGPRYQRCESMVIKGTEMSIDIKPDP